ncbi:MAG: glycosyltransferase [Pseudomonadota bacterium]
MSLPKTAYVLLWFPKPSETFIFREVKNIREMGLPADVHTLYGRLDSKISPEMESEAGRVERLGLPYLKTVFQEIWFWKRRDPALVNSLFHDILFRRWGSWEKTGENTWAFFCGFRLARRFLEEGVRHVHAPWAGGPATAAWTASRLCRIPFSFTARAWDIYPPDGALAQKVRQAAFVRAGTAHNLRYLTDLVGAEDAKKIHLTYNGVTAKNHGLSEVPLRPPYRFLALGRLVEKKGYDYLLEAAKMLADQGLDFTLTIAGDGPLQKKLTELAGALGLGERVSFPGFVPYHQVPDLFYQADLFLMPSIVASSGDRDGIPNVIMESLLHRVPVIATDISGIPELIEDRRTGLLIPQRDSRALARAVLEMVGDRDQALALAERGRAKVLEQFDPEKNYQRVIDLIVQTTPEK